MANRSWASRSRWSFRRAYGRLIPGFDQGFAGMHVGGKRRIFIPWQLAYGTREIPAHGADHPGIPAKSDLIFDVELVDVTDMPAMPQRPMGMPPHPEQPARASRLHPAAPAAPAHPATAASTEVGSLLRNRCDVAPILFAASCVKRMGPLPSTPVP